MERDAWIPLTYAALAEIPASASRRPGIRVAETNGSPSLYPTVRLCYRGVANSALVNAQSDPNILHVALATLPARPHKHSVYDMGYQAAASGRRGLAKHFIITVTSCPGHRHAQ